MTLGTRERLARAFPCRDRHVSDCFRLGSLRRGRSAGGRGPRGPIVRTMPPSGRDAAASRLSPGATSFERKRRPRCLSLDVRRLMGHVADLAEDALASPIAGVVPVAGVARLGDGGHYRCGQGQDREQHRDRPHGVHLPSWRTGRRALSTSMVREAHETRIRIPLRMSNGQRSSRGLEARTRRPPRRPGRAGHAARSTSIPKEENVADAAAQVRGGRELLLPAPRHHRQVHLHRARLQARRPGTGLEPHRDVDRLFAGVLGEPQRDQEPKFVHRFTI